MSALVNHCDACYFNPSHLICRAFQQSRHRIGRNLSLSEKNLWLNPWEPLHLWFSTCEPMRAVRNQYSFDGTRNQLNVGSGLSLPVSAIIRRLSKKPVSMSNTNQTRFSRLLGVYGYFWEQGLTGSFYQHSKDSHYQVLNTTARTLFQRRMTWAKR